MKKRIYLTMAFLMLAPLAFTQGDVRYEITGFEGLDFDWAYSGNSVVFSQIVWDDFQGGATLREGEQMLVVEYDNAVGGTWQWAQMNFFEPVDLTGATEIHMWVFVVKEQTKGNFEIRLDLPGGIGLGTRGIPSDQWGKWVELVWSMDHITSTQKVASVGNFGGFISAGDPPADSGVAANAGVFYIDEVFALRPAGTPEEYEEVVLWGFNEEDPTTGEPVGWTKESGAGIILGLGDVEPSEGENYGEIELSSGWVANVKSTDALAIFDQWPSVLEVMADVRVASDFSGGWLNFQLVMQSNGNGWDSYGEMGIAGAKDAWMTLLWSVDISKHAAAFDPTVEGRWFQMMFTTNQESSQAGKYMYIDNVRVVIPKGGTDVADWTLF